MKGWLALLVIALSAPAQNAYVEIVAPSVRLVAGDQMAMSVVVRDASGKVQPVSAPTWRVEPSTIAQIDGRGNLTGVNLGIAKVSVSANNMNTDVQIQVVPEKTEITPAAAQLHVGESVQYRAVAYGKGGVPLPVDWTWTVRDNYGEGMPTRYGTVDRTGLFTAGYQGTGAVRATFSYGSTLPGMMPSVVLEAEFRTSAVGYQLTKLYSSAVRKPESRWQPLAGPLYSTASGALLFNASLNGMSTALVEWKDGAVRPVITTGDPSPGLGQVVTALAEHSVVSSGDVLVASSPVIQQSVGGVLYPLLQYGMFTFDSFTLSSFVVSRYSLAADGSFLFGALYNIPGTNIQKQGIFRGSRLSNLERLISTEESLEGFPTGFALQSRRFGIAADGTAWYQPAFGQNAVWYRHGAEGRKRFLGVGDSVLNSTLRSFHNAGPYSYFTADNGDFLVGANLESGSVLLKFTGGVFDQLQSLRTTGDIGILDYKPEAGALLLGNPEGRGYGVWVWKDGSVRAGGMTGRTAAAGDVIQAVQSGTIEASGRVTLMARMTQRQLAIVRPDSGEILLQAGDTLAVPEPVVMAGFVPGARSGAVQMIAGDASAGSVVEWDGAAFRSLANYGDLLASGTSFNGTNIYGAAFRTPDGSLYLAWGKLYRRSEDGWVPVKGIPAVLDGTSYNVGSAPKVNASGWILWTAVAREQRLVLSREGEPTVLLSDGQASTPFELDGKVVSSWADTGLDDLGRAAALISFRGRNTPELYIWDADGHARRVLGVGDPGFHRAPVTSIQLRVSGSRLCALVTTALGTEIAEWNGDGWTTLLAPDEITPVGYPVQQLYGRGEVDGSGNVLFVCPNLDVFLKRNGKIQLVNTSALPTPDGDYLLQVTGFDFRDDGTVYFNGVNQRSEIVLYQARPVQ